MQPSKCSHQIIKLIDQILREMILTSTCKKHVLLYQKSKHVHVQKDLELYEQISINISFKIHLCCSEELLSNRMTVYFTFSSIPHNVLRLISLDFSPSLLYCVNNSVSCYKHHLIQESKHSMSGLVCLSMQSHPDTQCSLLHNEYDTDLTLRVIFQQHNVSRRRVVIISYFFYFFFIFFSDPRR